jgi:thioredoxin 1
MLAFNGHGSQAVNRALPGSGQLGSPQCADAAPFDAKPVPAAMPFATEYTDPEPRPEDVAALPGPTLLEFGTPWCGHCRALQPLLSQLMASHPGIRHIKVEDGSGKPLGRSFRVRLWPTLVFLCDGEELERMARPSNPTLISQALAGIDGKS